MAAGGAGQLTLAWSNHLGGVDAALVASALSGAGIALQEGAVRTLVPRLAPANLVGSAFGLVSLTGTVTATAAPGLAGLLLVTVSPTYGSTVLAVLGSVLGSQED